MNQALALEIYRNSPWMVDAPTFGALMRLLADPTIAMNIGRGEERANGIGLMGVSAADRIITRPSELSADVKGDELYYLINLNGTITKNGGMSTTGMKELSQRMLQFDADPRVRGGLMLGDSGGGSGAGMEVMAHAQSLLKKPLGFLVERGGMAGSAAYGIASGAKFIMAESERSIVGSLGTMMMFGGHPNGAINQDGEKMVTIYATKSVKKNQAFEDAINNSNYTIAINEILDPANEDFLAMIRKNRPKVLDSQLDGSVYRASEAVGTLVDEIGNFDMAMRKLKQMSAGRIVINSKTSNTAMTANEIKTQYPEAYQAIYNSGVGAEKDRTGAWLAHAATDMETVVKGIKGGEDLSATVREELLVKASSKAMLEKLKNGSAGAVVTNEAEGEAEDKGAKNGGANAEEKAVTDYFADVKKMVKLN